MGAFQIQLSGTQAMITVIVLVSVIGGLGIFILLKFKNFRIGKDGASFGSKVDVEAIKEKLIQLQAQTEIEIEQRKVLREKFTIIKEMDFQVYKKYCNENNIEAKYKLYLNVITCIYNEIKNILKNACFENHFSEKSEKEWREYLDDKLQYILIEMNKFLEIYMSKDLAIDIGEYQKYQSSNFTTDLQNELSEIFNKCKEITIKIPEKLKGGEK